MHLISIFDSPHRQPIGNEYQGSVAIQLPFGCCPLVVRLLSALEPNNNRKRTQEEPNMKRTRDKGELKEKRRLAEVGMEAY